jgi:hypothetical protein
MPFFGDQAWFYLSARNALLTGQFPLLGITSSVTWLHQGPLWTYFLIPSLAISHFHPVSGGVLTALLGSLTIILCYFLGRIWFGVRAGLAAAFIFAMSPLAIIHARMPYHTSPIPLFVALFLLLLTQKKYFLSSLMLGFLFQLELVTVIFWPVYLLFLIRLQYVPRFRDVLGFVLGILPLLISGPVQVGGVFVWALYHRLVSTGSTVSPLPFYSNLLNRFFSPGIPLLPWFLLALSVIYAIIRKRLEILWLVVPLILIFFNGTGSEAYSTLLFVPLSLFFGLFISKLFPRHLMLVFFTAWWLINSHYLLKNDYAIDMESYGVSIISRQNLSSQIFTQSLTGTPTLNLVGPGSQFASTKDPYKYLIWYESLFKKPSGRHLEFEINNTDQTFRVLK